MQEQQQSTLELPPLLHVGIVVLDLSTAAGDFERRWGTRVTEIADLTLVDALYHGRRSTISLRRGFIKSGASEIELIQPVSSSPFGDFLRERNGGGVHHLAYSVDDIEPYLSKLNPTSTELVLDAELPGSGGRIVCIDGFAHGPAIELIQCTRSEPAGPHRRGGSVTNVEPDDCQSKARPAHSRSGWSRRE
jgi:methylmalonyl-CoA/ethylmalonyl-CoA epimerase